MLRLNPLARPLPDALSHKAAQTVSRYDEQYKRLVNGVYLAPEFHAGAGRLMRAFRLVTEAHPAAKRVILAQRARQITPHRPPAEVADEAVKAGVINAQEAQLLKYALGARLAAIEVDVFTPDQFYSGLATSVGTAPKGASAKESGSALAANVQ